MYPSEAINEVTVSDANVHFNLSESHALSCFIFSSDPIFFWAIVKKHIY